jgi:hypothetical protein
MTPKKPTSALDQPWPYGHVSTPILWGLAVFATGGVLDATDIAAWWVAAVGALLAVVSPMVALAINSPLRSRWYAGLLAASTGGYLTWTTWSTPWQRNAALVLIPGVIVFGAWWDVIVRTTDKAARAAAMAKRQHEQAVEKLELPKILAAAKFMGIEPGARTPFPDPTAGYTQKLILPPDGSVTLKMLQSNTDKIETAGRLKFPIRFSRGASSAEVIAQVLLRDVLLDSIPYPIDRAPKSIHKPIPLGHRETGELAVVTFRELAGLFVGTRGSGKSGLLNSHLAYLTGCTDALIWMIDGKGGRTARPWLKPFLEATTGKPALDYIAVTQEEADWVLMAAKAAIAIRSRGDGEKINPSPHVPAIILIVEEASLITGVGNVGNVKRSDLARDVIVLGRSEAVDGIIVAQRGTVTMLGSGDMKSQLQYRIGLGVESVQDAQMIFDDSSMARELFRFSEDDRYKGVFLAKAPGWKSILPIKGYKLVDSDIIAGVALTNSAHQPELDQETADYVHEVLVAAGAEGGYYGRWERTARDLKVDLPATYKAKSPAATAPAQAPAQKSPAGGVPNPDGRTTAEKLGLPESTILPSPFATPKSPEQQPEPVTVPAAPEPVDVDAQFQAIIAGFDTEPAAEGEHVPHEEAADMVPRILLTVARVFDVMQAEKVHTSRILAELPGELTPKRLGLLMNYCGVTSLPEPIEVDGVRARGYARADVLKAIGRARAGGKLPKSAFDWPDRL